MSASEYLAQQIAAFVLCPCNAPATFQAALSVLQAAQKQCWYLLGHALDVHWRMSHHSLQPAHMPSHHPWTTSL